MALDNMSSVISSAAWQQRNQEVASDLIAFIGGPAKEGERTLVIGGAARPDVALERLLKSVMRHQAGGSDSLFDPDRPLGTFSAKIALAYRLGLIDDDFEHALHVIRRIRNDFAHAITLVHLADSANFNRVRELTNIARKAPHYETGPEAISKMVPEGVSHRDLIVSLVVVLFLLAAGLERTAMLSSPTNFATAKIQEL